MKCLKCGAYVYSSDKFCRSCGTTLNSDTCQYGDNIPNSEYDSSSCHDTQYNYSYKYSNKTEPKYDMNATHAEQYNYNTNYSYDMSKYNYAYQPNDSGDDKYIKAYIGPNYEKIKKMKFSLPALIFGPWYLLYRKVWGYALGAIFISIAATLLLEPTLANAVDLVIKIYFGFKFKDIYFKQVENRVENIEQQSLDKSTSELIEVCKKKGGTSIRILVTLFLTFIIISILATAYFESNKYESSITEEQEHTAQQLKGQVDKLYYSLPIGYKQIYSSEYTQIFTYNDYNLYCSFKAETRVPYGKNSNPITYLNAISEQSSEIASITKNNHEWLYKQIKKTNIYESIYAHKYYDTLYVLTFENTDYYACNKQYEEILNSLTFSKL